jgi:hypothetical protein
MGFEKGEKDYIANAGSIRKKHNKAIHAEPDTHRRRKTVLKSAQVIFVELHRLEIPVLALNFLPLKALTLIVRIVELPKAVGDLPAQDKELKPFAEVIPGRWMTAGKGAYQKGKIKDKGRLFQPIRNQLLKKTVENNPRKKSGIRIRKLLDCVEKEFLPAGIV